MPPGTKLRNIRVDDDLWESAKVKAEAEGISLSELIREWMREYVK